ncbi:hypothetical protein [Zoogloea sp.]|uniref:hypothetical protein n=1 Tax=Zoogloea sp. TaxID=49181 RepID=UPI0035B10B3C
MRAIVPGPLLRLRTALYPLACGLLAASGLLLTQSGLAGAPDPGSAVASSALAVRPSGWRGLAGEISRLARAAGLKTAWQDDDRAINLTVDTTQAFENRQAQLSPSYASLLGEIALMVQARPEIRLIMTGFGNTPATHYNPVLFGLRLKALQVFFAEHGIAIGQIETLIKDADSASGHDMPAGRAAAGRLISLRFVPA